MSLKYPILIGSLLAMAAQPAAGDRVKLRRSPGEPKRPAMDRTLPTEGVDGATVDTTDGQKIIITFRDGLAERARVSDGPKRAKLRVPGEVGFKVPGAPEYQPIDPSRRDSNDEVGTRRVWDEVLAGQTSTGDLVVVDNHGHDRDGRPSTFVRWHDRDGRSWATTTVVRGSTAAGASAFRFERKQGAGPKAGKHTAREVIHDDTGHTVVQQITEHAPDGSSELWRRTEGNLSAREWIEVFERVANSLGLTTRRRVESERDFDLGTDATERVGVTVETSHNADGDVKGWKKQIVATITDADGHELATREWHEEKKGRTWRAEIFDADSYGYESSVAIREFELFGVVFVRRASSYEGPHSEGWVKHEEARTEIRGRGGRLGWIESPLRVKAKTTLTRNDGATRKELSGANREETAEGRVRGITKTRASLGRTQSTRLDGNAVVHEERGWLNTVETRVEAHYLTDPAFARAIHDMSGRQIRRAVPTTVTIRGPFGGTRVKKTRPQRHLLLGHVEVDDPVEWLGQAEVTFDHQGERVLLNFPEADVEHRSGDEQSLVRLLGDFAMESRGGVRDGEVDVAREEWVTTEHRDREMLHAITTAGTEFDLSAGVRGVGDRFTSVTRDSDQDDGGWVRTLVEEQSNGTVVVTEEAGPGSSERGTVDRRVVRTLRPNNGRPMITVEEYWVGADDSAILERRHTLEGSWSADNGTFVRAREIEESFTERGTSVTELDATSSGTRRTTFSGIPWLSEVTLVTRIHRGIRFPRRLEGLSSLVPRWLRQLFPSPEPPTDPDAEAAAGSAAASAAEGRDPAADPPEVEPEAETAADSAAASAAADRDPAAAPAAEGSGPAGG